MKDKIKKLEENNKQLDSLDSIIQSSEEYLDEEEFRMLCDDIAVIRVMLLKINKMIKDEKI